MVRQDGSFPVCLAPPVLVATPAHPLSGCMGLEVAMAGVTVCWDRFWVSGPLFGSLFGLVLGSSWGYPLFVLGWAWLCRVPFGRVGWRPVLADPFLGPGDPILGVGGPHFWVSGPLFGGTPWRPPPDGWGLISSAKRCLQKVLRVLKDFVCKNHVWCFSCVIIFCSVLMCPLTSFCVTPKVSSLPYCPVFIS
jgi:hypothetical protein